MAEPVAQCPGHHTQRHPQKIKDRDDPDSLIQRKSKLITDHRQRSGRFSDLKRSRNSCEDQDRNSNPVGPRRQPVTE